MKASLHLLLALFFLLQAMPLFCGERERREALKAAFRERKILWEERPLLAEYGGFGSSLLIRPGRQNRGSEGAEEAALFVLAVPLTGWGELPAGGEEAEELPLRFAAALSFIDKINGEGRAAQPEVIVAFLGDQGTALPPEMVKRPRRGLEDLLGLLEDTERTVLWYLDTGSREGPEGLEISHGTAGRIASLGIIRRIPGLCKELSIPWSFAAPFNGLYKLRLLKGPPALRRIFQEDADALYVSAVHGALPSPALSGENLGEFLYRYVETLDTGGERDRHYAMIQFPPATVFLSEYAIAVFFLSGSAVSLLLLLIFRNKRRSSGVKLSSLIIIALIGAGILVSGFLDISFIPLWAAAFLFVLPAGILHKPVPLFAGTFLAIAYILWVGLFFFRQREVPAADLPPVRELAAPEPGLLRESGEGGGFGAEIQGRELLGLRIIDLSLHSGEAPLRFDVSLSSSGPPILIHSAPVPFALGDKGGSAEFFLGEDPPNPLNMEIYLSGDFKGILRAEALYRAAEGGYLRVFKEIGIGD
ncbi:MAG: hypothetical protein LBR93_05420 [Treponema sp.]|jgi:hypothetical protein|nr:hypothetical protein [Treponema sp.]